MDCEINADYLSLELYPKQTLFFFVSLVIVFWANYMDFNHNYSPIMNARNCSLLGLRFWLWGLFSHTFSRPWKLIPGWYDLIPNSTETPWGHNRSLQVVMGRFMPFLTSFKPHQPQNKQKSRNFAILIQ